MRELRLFVLFWAVVLGAAGIAAAALGRYGVNVMALGFLYAALATNWNWMRSTGLFSLRRPSSVPARSERKPGSSRQDGCARGLPLASARWPAPWPRFL